MSTVTTQIPARMDRLPFGSLLGDGEPGTLAIGYAIGAALMAVAAIVELLVGVDAEGESPEDIAEPLSATGA